METATTESQHSPFFEEFMASMEALRKKQEETARQMAETDRLMREQREDTARRMAETDRLMREQREDSKETERLVKEVTKQMGGMANSFGGMIENMVAPKLLGKFHKIGYSFERTGTGIKYKDKANKIEFEVDVMLENGSLAILVETKVKADTDDVNEHIERLGKMRAYADLHGDRRKFLGAIAGAVMPENVKNYAFKNGFYVLMPSGDTFNILPSPGSFVPREW